MVECYYCLLFKCVLLLGCHYFVLFNCLCMSLPVDKCLMFVEYYYLVLFKCLCVLIDKCMVFGGPVACLVSLLCFIFVLHSHRLAHSVFFIITCYTICLFVASISSTFIFFPPVFIFIYIFHLFHWRSERSVFVDANFSFYLVIWCLSYILFCAYAFLHQLASLIFFFLA